MFEVTDPMILKYYKTVVFHCMLMIRELPKSNTYLKTGKVVVSVGNKLIFKLPSLKQMHNQLLHCYGH
jgi:hypothetical protein